MSEIQSPYFLQSAGNASGSIRQRVEWLEANLKMVGINATSDTLVTALGESMLDISKTTSVINIVNADGEKLASILPSPLSTTGWLFGQADGWKLATVDEFSIEETTTLQDLVTWMADAEHSTKIASDSDLLQVAQQVYENTQAIQAIAVTGGASVASAVVFPDGETLSTKMSRKTEKIRVDIVGNSPETYQFKLGTQVLNFADLNNLLQNSPNFCVFVHGNREHRCTLIDLDSNPKQMRFVAPLLSDGLLKTQSVYVTSENGTDIKSITVSNINSENKTDADALRVRVTVQEQKVSDLSANEGILLNLNSGAGNLTDLGSFKAGDIVYIDLISNDTTESIKICALLQSNAWRLNLDPTCSVYLGDKPKIYTFEHDYDHVYIGVYAGVGSCIFAKLSHIDNSIFNRLNELKQSIITNSSDIRELSRFNEYENYDIEKITGSVVYPRVGSFKTGDIIKLKLNSISTDDIKSVALIPVRTYTQNLNPACVVKNAGDEIVYTFEHDYDDVYIGIYSGTANVTFKKITTPEKEIRDSLQYLNLLTAPINAFEKVELHDGGAIDLDNQIVAHNDFGYTDYIEVPNWCNRIAFLNVVTIGSTQYSLQAYQVAQYDADKQFISTLNGNKTLDYISKEIDPKVVRYVRVNYGKKEKNAGKCIVHFFRQEQDVRTGYKPIIWDNKTGNFIGDSITEQTRYTSALTSMYGIVVNNYGISGTTISNLRNAFHNRVAGMSSDCDFVFILGGTNDWGLGATLGSKTDTTDDTFFGGLYMMFEALRTKFPTKHIFISTILQRDWQTPPQPSGIDSNANGNSIAEFNDAIRYMASRYGAVVIDGFGESGIIVKNIDTYTSDRLHLNPLGGQVYAKCIKDKMEQYTL